MTVRTVGQIFVSGAISGNGSVVKTNLGTLSFIGTGANSYSGSTLVSEGILALEKPELQSQVHSPLATVPEELTPTLYAF